MSSALRLLAALLVAGWVAWLSADRRMDLAAPAWLACAVMAAAGRGLNAYALRPGKPPLLALAGQVARVAVLAGVLVGAEDALGPGYRAFVRAGLAAFGVLLLEEVVDLVLRAQAVSAR